MLPVGGRVIPWFIAKIVKTRSNELFTVAVLVMAFAIAVVEQAIGVVIAEES